MEPPVLRRVVNLRAAARPWFAWAVALALSCACASKPAAPPLMVEKDVGLKDPREDERLVLLNHELRRKSAEIEKLQAKVEALSSLAESPGSRKPVTKKPEAAALRKAAALPVMKLKPSAPPAESEPDEAEAQGESIVDSRHETMHLYYEALDSLRARRHDDAVRALTEFIRRSREHVYADRAQYLLAETHLSGGEYSLAIVAANRLEGEYPNSVRVPDSMYVRARAYEAMGNAAQATGVLRELVRRFPATPLFEKASRKLAELTVSGRGT